MPLCSIELRLDESVTMAFVDGIFGYFVVDCLMNGCICPVLMFQQLLHQFHSIKTVQNSRLLHVEIVKKYKSRFQDPQATFGSLPKSSWPGPQMLAEQRLYRRLSDTDSFPGFPA